MQAGTPTPIQSSSMKFLRALVVLVVLALAAGVYLLDYDRPALPTNPLLVDVPAGTGSAGIAARLQAAGVIRSRYLFLLQRRLSGGTLKAGVYRFERPSTVLETYAHIARGDVYTLTLTIPEGFNLFETAQAVQAAGLAPAATFLAAARSNTQLIADLDPGATSLEGFLFPDTYKFSPHATPAQMLAVMVHRFRQQATSLGLPTQPESLRSIVTMASLIEKEVHIDAERPLVAGVFTNRLALNMPLATDPAVIYAALLANRWRGTIYQSDLQFDSPYNTYKHPGLPPGPICNPGLAALRAALHPTRTDYLYFVADAGGTTRFSATLAEHNAQVAAYRQATSQATR